MTRDLSPLSASRFDVLVIGGGVVGACVAWDAALRGLFVALIERDDFGAGTSSNSLKIVHGGLRYLQQLDWRRMRESIRERSVWLRIAPHLVEPLPVLVPTYRRGLQRRELLRAAIAVSDAVAWDRNRGLEVDRRLPAGHALTRAEVRDRVPELDRPDLTGGVIFFDAQMYNSERLVLEIVQAAQAAGAVVANYAAFESRLEHNGKLVGARVTDVLKRTSLEVRARVVINCTGHAATKVAASLSGRSSILKWPYSLAVNVVVPSRGHRIGFAVRGAVKDRKGRSDVGTRQFFFAPWRDRLLVGTGHYEWSKEAASFDLHGLETESFLAEVNAAWPGTPIDPAEVLLVHGGLIPVRTAGRAGRIRFLKRHAIIDHAEDGVPNALTVLTGKYTTARAAAEGAVSRIGQKLGKRLPRCRTAETLLPGGTVSVGALQRAAVARFGGTVDGAVLEHLVRTYGRGYEIILAYRNEVDGWDWRPVESEPVIKAQWVHAVRKEWAVLPEDLVWRRSELGARGLASPRVLAAARDVHSAERDSGADA